MENLDRLNEEETEARYIESVDPNCNECDGSGYPKPTKGEPCPVCWERFQRDRL